MLECEAHDDSRLVCHLPEKIMTNTLPDETPESDDSSAFSIDPEDPMRDYLMERHREMKALKKSAKKSKKDKHKDETREQRQARKTKKREKKLRKEQGKSEGMKGVEELLKNLQGRAKH